MFKPSQEKLNRKLVKAIVNNGPQETIIRLIEQGADVDSATYYGRPAIVSVVLNRNTKVLTSLIQRDVALDKVDSYGRTALIMAADYGYKEQLSLLLASGADVNWKDKEGNTALHYAAQGGKMDIAQLLLRHGAQVDAVNGCGSRPADLAAKEYPGVQKFLEQEEKKNAPVIDSEWRLQPPDEIIHVTDKASCGYRITEIFNFATRTHVHIVRNLETNAESHNLRSFTDCGDMEAIAQAAAKFEEKGGVIASEHTLRLIQKPKTLQLGQGGGS